MENFSFRFRQTLLGDVCPNTVAIEDDVFQVDKNSTIFMNIHEYSLVMASDQSNIDRQGILMQILLVA